MELAFGIVVVGVLGGLTVLSYGQHETFRKIALPLYWTSLLTLLGLAGEYLGTRTTIQAMRPFVDPDKASEAQAVAASLVTPWWVMIGILGFIGYLFFLLFLPMILGTHKKGDPSS
jgi:hypothetical protein